VPREDTIWSVKDRIKKNKVGKPKRINLVELIFLCSRGKRKANMAKEGDMTAELAKPILPQNNLTVLSFRKYTMKKLNAQPAADQARIENEKLIRR